MRNRYGKVSLVQFQQLWAAQVAVVKQQQLEAGSAGGVGRADGTGGAAVDGGGWSVTKDGAKSTSWKTS